MTKFIVYDSNGLKLYEGVKFSTSFTVAIDSNNTLRMGDTFEQLLEQLSRLHGVISFQLIG